MIIPMGDLPAHNAARLGGNRLALQHDQESVSWGELEARATRRAWALRDATERRLGPLPNLRWPTKSLYGLGALGSAVKSQLAGLVLLFYNQLVGLDASSVGLAMLVALLVDAFWDPVVGQLSDNTRGRLGRRHPYIYAAAVPSLLFFVAIFAPPHGWGRPALLLYFLFVTLGSRLCDSLIEVPSAALLPELSHDYDERTSLSSWRYVYRGVIGPALAAFLAFGLFLRGTPAQPYGQLNPAGYAPYAWTVATITLVAVLASALATQRFVPHMYRPERRAPDLRAMLGEIAIAVSNRNFAAIAGFALLIGVVTGVAGGLASYMSTFFWELPSSALLQLGLAAIPAALVGVIAASPVARRLDKKRASLITMLLSVICSLAPIGFRLLGMMPPNSSPWVLRILIAAMFLSTLLFTIGAVIISSMIADVVEEVEVKTQRRSEGVLYAADTLLLKLTTSFSVAIPGVLLDYVGFPKGAKPGHVSTAVLNHLALIYLPLIAGLCLAAISMLLFYQIDRGRHAQNLSRVAQARTLAEEETDPEPEPVSAPAE